MTDCLVSAGQKAGRARRHADDLEAGIAGRAGPVSGCAGERS